MPEFRVCWEIDIEADNPEEAAARALIVQRDNDPANSATVFDVRRRIGSGFGLAVRVDLSNQG